MDTEFKVRFTIENLRFAYTRYVRVFMGGVKKVLQIILFETLTVYVSRT
jgi:hypothetical protein